MPSLPATSSAPHSHDQVRSTANPDVWSVTTSGSIAFGGVVVPSTAAAAAAAAAAVTPDGRDECLNTPPAAPPPLKLPPGPTLIGDPAPLGRFPEARLGWAGAVPSPTAATLLPLLPPADATAAAADCCAEGSEASTTRLSSAAASFTAAAGGGGVGARVSAARAAAVRPLPLIVSAPLERTRMRAMTVSASNSFRSSASSTMSVRTAMNSSALDAQQQQQQRQQTECASSTCQVDDHNIVHNVGTHCNGRKCHT
jgi:hypothetical protein